MHRLHSAYCVVCGNAVPQKTLNTRKHKEEPLLCHVCLRSPPEEFLCGALNSAKKKCRTLGMVRFNGRCRYHK